MDELKQARSLNKSAGKDAKRLRANPNRTLEAPDMPDTTPLVSLDGPGEEILRRCIKLRRAGRTLLQVAQALGVPLETLYGWRQEHPSFFEGMQEGFDDFVEAKAEQVLSIADQLPKVRGLKPGERMLAMKHQAGIRLRVAEAKLPNWRREGEGGAGVLLQVELGGPIKTTNLPGSVDGQNVKALAAGRWQLPPREEALLERSRGSEDSAAAGGSGNRSRRAARPFPGPGSSEQTQGAEGAAEGHD